MRIMVIYPPDEAVKPEQKFVVETVVEEVEAALNETFRRFNCVTGDAKTEDCVRLRIRSMSVGDVVKAPLESDGKYFVVCGIGWKEIGVKELNELRKLDFGSRNMKYMRKGD